MAKRPKEISIFSMAFLDVISNALAAILLVYLLVAARQRQSAADALQSRVILFAVRATGVDDSGKDIPVQMRVYWGVWSPGDVGEEAMTVKEPMFPPTDLRSSSWKWFSLPDDTLAAARFCQNPQASGLGEFCFCLLRGVNTPNSLFRLAVLCPNGSDHLREVHLRGWITDANGRRQLSTAMLRNLSSQDAHAIQNEAGEVVLRKPDGPGIDWPKTSFVVLQSTVDKAETGRPFETK